jgi:magnesium-protoporphyrin O-methyltransferase
MTCCCPQAGAAGRFFSHFARLHRRFYQKMGLQKTQKQLVEGLRQAGFADARLLEIGCGVGYLHQHLLAQGAASAVGIDLSEKMLEEARRLAAQRGLANRTRYILGDFVALADGLEPADVTILDKVICCYPDADSLVETSLARTRRVYAFTIPRDRWFVRAGVALTAFFLRLVRSGFRTYVHDPERIHARVAAQGFHKLYENRTAVWLTRVYVRSS